MLDKEHPQLSLHFCPTVAQIVNYRSKMAEIYEKKPSPTNADNKAKQIDQNILGF